jgi:hypothetical protein
VQRLPVRTTAHLLPGTPRARPKAADAMRFKHHIKRLELQASECQRSLDEVAETHRGLRARALAVNHIVDQAEALLACAEALAAEGEPTPSSSGTCPTPPRHAVANYSLLALAGRGAVLQELSDGLTAAGAPAPACVAGSTMGGNGASGSAAGSGNGGSGNGGDAPALQTPSVSWWPAGAEHLAAASRIDSVEALRHSSQSTVQAIGILLP